MSDPLSSLVSINTSLSYQFDEKSLLGRGASSTVHKGTFNKEDVAVKRMNQELSKEYKELLLSIKHENIVLVLCIESYIGLDYIVLELCLASLYQYFEEFEKVMNKFEGLTVVKKDVNQDAVRGLQYLHEKGIVHRDIKPGNILLVQKRSSTEVKAVLADFGLSKKLDDNQFSKTTVEGRGTKAYMAPELLVEDGKCTFSRQSDIFSMGCVIYFAETDGNHPFDTGDSCGSAIYLNVKNHNPCDFHLLDGKPIATALIRKMIKRNRALRPSASEVLQDPYFKEDDPQDTIQVPPQLIKGEEAPQPQGDTPQDISEVHDGANILPPEQSASADGEGHTSTPPPEQSVADMSYGKQLYDSMSNMSDSLPRYIVDHYIRLLAFANVKCDMKPDWLLSRRFLELYSTHTSEKSPQVAASYVYKILTGLGYEEMEDFRAYLHTEVEIDTKITEELERITEFRPAVIEVVRDELGPRLDDYQIDRYRMVLTVLRSTKFDSNKSFFELFTDLTGKLGKYPLAVSLTVGVLERSGWGDTKKLKPFSLPNFDINTAYPEVDLCLTVADYYGNMSQRDFSSAKVYTSSVHLKGHNVSNMSRVQFTLLLMERGVVKVGNAGNNVSKIEDKVRYPIFFKEYKERCKGPSKETAPTTDETVVVPSLPVQETVATQETVASQETKAQATSGQSQSTSTDQPGFLTRKLSQFKNFIWPSSRQEAQEVAGTATQANKEPTPDSSNTAPGPTVTSAAKEGTHTSLIQKYSKMRDEFNSLLLEVASEAKESLDEVKSCLLLIRQEANWKREVEAVTDETSLAQLLQRYCFLSNLSLLKYIIEKLDLKEYKSRIDRLAEERDAFYSEVPAEDFAAAGIEDHEMIKEHHVEMSVVVSWPSSEATLARLLRCIAEEFKDDNLSMFIAPRAVHHSDLTFECTVPIWLEPAIGLALAAFVIGSVGSGILYATLNNKKYIHEPVAVPPHKLFPEVDGKEYEKKLSDDDVKDIVKDIRILLMTATDVELRGVLGYLKPLDGRDKIIKSFINNTWIYIGKYGGYSVVVGKSANAKSQQGGLDALTITNKIMEIFKPKYIIAVGICFGMDRSKVNLGDVIVSDFIVDLSDFRKEPGSITARKPQPPAGTTLSSFFSDTSGFKMKHSQEENAKEVNIHCGPIASSPVLVDDEEFKKELSKVRPDALAGEMEGAAIFSAARHAHHKPEAIVIKAVGDWGDGKKDECRGWKDFGSHAAARYVHHHLDDVSQDALK